MNVKCGINGESRYVGQIFLCHHCGMPVCEEHGWVVAADDAFSGTAPAMHCRNCMERYHKTGLKRHGWADPRPQPVGPVIGS